MVESVRDLIFRLIDQSISDEDFQLLQDAIEQDDEVRAEYLRAVCLCESLTEIAAEQPSDHSSPDERIHAETQSVLPAVSQMRLVQIAVAAALLVAVGSVVWWFAESRASRSDNSIAIKQSDGSDSAELVAPKAERTIAGYATLRRAAGVQWAGLSRPYFEGDVLSPGLLKFDHGIVEIDFFCGASIVVEGPAELDLESDWSMRFLQGRLRASVPPAAQGFIVKAADSEIIDLGTEFALEVGADQARLEVIEGEVKLRGGVRDGDHLRTGEEQWLKGNDAAAPSLAELSTSRDVLRRSEDAQRFRFQQWRETLQQSVRDERLIAWYPISNESIERTVRNAANDDGQRDGTLVGPVGRTAGRFGNQSVGLTFDRPGARVRVRIDGEFQAFTFGCWTKINSLDHRYNALFMGDGYENGEPHWQIRDDGRLMFSVMVDDSVEVLHRTRFEPEPVKDAGLHRVYYSKPFWDESMSGQWFHLVAVYDPAGRQVIQYVNGEEVCREEITDRFHVSSLRIGAAEIGNWGQPFRKSPWFAVRHLNGTIDEMVIFNAALGSEEIRLLHEQGKPPGY